MASSYFCIVTKYGRLHRKFDFIYTTNVKDIGSQIKAHINAH